MNNKNKIIKSVFIFFITFIGFQLRTFAQPNWVPVIYTNSTTAYGIVTIDGNPASIGDIVGAFVGNECRAVGDIIINQNNAYVSLVIQGEEIEIVEFKVYDASENQIYDVAFTTQTNPGGVIGSPPNYLPLEVNTGSNLPQPPINPNPSNGATDVDINSSLSWENGGGATSYKVYFGTDSTPDNTEYKGEQTETSYEPGTLIPETEYFWRIDAVNSYGTIPGDLWSFTTASNETEPYWRIFNTSNSGLPNNNITSIAIDDLGNKWIGTEAGLVKYDGITWTVYTTSNSGLPDNYIVFVNIDKEGNKWIGTFAGLVKYDGINWTVNNTSNSPLPSNMIYSIDFDRTGKKWIGTVDDGLLVYDDVSWVIYNTSNSGLPANRVYTVKIDDFNNKWLGTEGGLAKFDDTNWDSFNSNNSGLPQNYVNSISIDKQNNKWIGTQGGLAKFDEVNWEVYNSSNSTITNNVVWTVTIDSNGIIWMGSGWNESDGGLVKYDGINWEVYNSKNSIVPNNIVRTISIDKYNNKWIGTEGGGVCLYNENEITERREKLEAKIKSIFLSQNYPNPFNPSTKIKYEIPKSSQVQLVVYDILGREVTTLVNEQKPAGSYEVEFNASNLSNGVYFYELRAGDFRDVKKLVLLK